MSGNCKKPREDLLLYVETTDLGRDGASPKLCEEIAQHLQTCETCREEARRIRANLDEIHSLRPLEVPADLNARIGRKIRERGRRAVLRPIPALTVAAVATVLIAVTVNLPTLHQPDVKPISDTRNAQLAKLLDEQERWIIILGDTLQQLRDPEYGDVYEAGTYIVSRLDRSTDALREAIQEGGLSPKMTPLYEQQIRQQIDLLKDFYFESSSSSPQDGLS